ncbi:60S ribosomal protein L10-like [Cebus imitator]|uniref:60S ribosomal protein L10-like n=1 Tax=Cebus imitator TaxID=2715852 RepID=UPI00189735C5|nr:60S ribosomal protein L10-like [Cebus imitator]
MGDQCAMAANSSFLGSVCSLFLAWVALGDLGDRPSRYMFMCLTLHFPNRLQTGMRRAFGKPQGTVARVHIGQVIMSIRTKLQNKEHVTEALRRAKFKFAGRQKIHISKKWGFTEFNADEFEDMVAEKRLIPDGCGVKYIPNRGSLDKWRALYS